MAIEVIVGIIAAIASLGGSFVGAVLNNKVVTYKVEQLEKKVEKVDVIENNQIEINSQLESFTSTAGERRKMVEEMKEEINKLKNEMAHIQTKIALIEKEIKMYHGHD